MLKAEAWTQQAPAIPIDDLQELERQKDEVTGKVVVFNTIFNTRYLAAFKSYGETGAYRRSGPSLAPRYSAEAVVIRSVTAATDNVLPAVSLMYDSAYLKIPADAMGFKDADTLIARLPGGEEVQPGFLCGVPREPDLFLKTRGTSTVITLVPMFLKM